MPPLPAFFIIPHFGFCFIISPHFEAVTRFFLAIFYLLCLPQPMASSIQKAHSTRRGSCRPPPFSSIPPPFFFGLIQANERDALPTEGPALRGRPSGPFTPACLVGKVGEVREGRSGYVPLTTGFNPSSALPPPAAVHKTCHASELAATSGKAVGVCGCVWACVGVCTDGL